MPALTPIASRVTDSGVTPSSADTATDARFRPPATVKVVCASAAAGHGGARVSAASARRTVPRCFLVMHSSCGSVLRRRSRNVSRTRVAPGYPRKMVGGIREPRPLNWGLRGSSTRSGPPGPRPLPNPREMSTPLDIMSSTVVIRSPPPCRGSSGRASTTKAGSRKGTLSAHTPQRGIPRLNMTSQPTSPTLAIACSAERRRMART